MRPVETPKPEDPGCEPLAGMSRYAFGAENAAMKSIRRLAWPALTGAAVALAAAHGWPQTSAPPAAVMPAQGSRGAAEKGLQIVGAASCVGRSCHGSLEPRTPGPESRCGCRHDEWTTILTL